MEGKAVYWFKELSKDSLAVAGGKGANLGEMYNARFPVPPGFAVSAQAYYDFVQRNGIDKLIAAKTMGLDVQDTQALQEASEAIKNAITEAPVPEETRAAIVQAYNKLCGGGLIPGMAQEVFVAVRSSATAEDLPQASFAGQQATFLNVIGAEEVVKAVRKCWASLFEARAIYYRTEQGFDHLRVGISAIVQKMVDSEKSGVMFSVDPVSEDANRIVIEAGFGLGEAIVSGQITPDRYVVDKESKQIIGKEIVKQTVMITRTSKGETEHVEVPEEIQEKQKLSDEEILRLSDYGKRIEAYYGFPQDMEWAVEGRDIFIVQTRAVTTLGKGGKKAGEQISEEEEREGEIGEPEKIVAETEGKAPAVTTEKNILLRGFGASPGIASGAVKIVSGPKELGKIQKGDVLVTEMTSPDYVPAMKRASAIVTDSGGMTCHAAIVSRELGIPCIVGTKEATQTLKEGQTITVDAKTGVVYDGVIDLGGKEERKQFAGGGVAMAAGRGAPLITGTKLYVNIADPEKAEEVAQLDCDGVGLLRAEFMIAGLGKHPKKLLQEGKQEEFINALAEGLRRVAAAFNPRPVVYRATDFKTNEYRNLEGGGEFEPKEENPMIGYRGCFRYVKDPEVFRMELKAVKKVREEFGLKNLWLMIPFVRRVGELKNAKELMIQEGLYQTLDFKLWIMVEVPSTVLIIDDFLDVGINGISFGTNDLTQLILGVDRDSSTMAEEFDERNHAVLKALKYVIKRCARRGVTTSFCGQAVSVYPEVAEEMVRAGITSVSVNPDVIELTRKVLAAAEQRILLEKARKN